jgi:hypothetical protein
LANGHGANLVQQTHPFCDGAAGTAKINGLPAGARCCRTLDDSDTEAGVA